MATYRHDPDQEGHEISEATHRLDTSKDQDLNELIERQQAFMDDIRLAALILGVEFLID